jgi:GTP cyclohydrolase II
MAETKKASKRKETSSSGTENGKKAKEVKYSYPNWKSLHEDFEAGKYLGVYGGCNSAWHGLAGIKAGKDLTSYHKKRSPDEFYLESLDTLLKDPHTRRRWDHIVTFDPLGLYASPPTQAGTTCKMSIPELKLVKDKLIVNEDGTINAAKVAVDYVWNIKGIAERLRMDEKEMRKVLADYTQNEKIVTETSTNVFLPPLGGLTLYLIGDITKLRDEHTEVAVRVHDSCCGSDVFGTDICTCRPYLVYAIQGAVECAQRGGVGVIIYFQKEGRSLGEVTKYRVYNARKRQKGGDRAEKYFYQTEAIAGIRDARFQDLMPDALLWLGITRIHWLLSMSSEKYEAIVDAGIEVMQRVPLPDMYVPEGALVEITAKISAGYHAETIQTEKIVEQFRSLEAVRARTHKVFELAKEHKASHFELDLKKLPECAKYVIKVIKENYPTLDIPYHSRWRHFDSKMVTSLTSKWPCSADERARRLLDLVTVSVFLDAGAGRDWKFVDQRGHVLERSEGLAAASLNMFSNGLFSSDVAIPHRVNSHGLKALSLDQVRQGFQVSEQNQLIGLKDRYQLLKRLGKALEGHPEFFGSEVCRPGNIVDYIKKHAVNNRVSNKVLWKAIIEGFETIWPENLSAVRRGDVWVYTPLKEIGKPASDLIPFHKLSQWLAYSMLEPIEELGIKFDDLDLMTGLAEYRNGGLFVDFEVITPRDPNTLKIELDVGSEILVEWRALTVALLDILADEIRKNLGKSKAELPLPKILQGGTWAAGRAIAAEKRPESRASPIRVRSNGTVF